MKNFIIKFQDSISAKILSIYGYLGVGLFFLLRHYPSYFDESFKLFEQLLISNTEKAITLIKNTDFMNLHVLRINTYLWFIISSLVIYLIIYKYEYIKLKTQNKKTHSLYTAIINIGLMSFLFMTIYIFILDINWLRIFFIKG
ncbi:MAG: hypothetical protein NC200_08520 [Candidatus Gastranaerophilales bacterium]|nr:hypothetical protein [Candidatus Gastranaerophilales bacterium]